MNITMWKLDVPVENMEMTNAILTEERTRDTAMEPDKLVKGIASKINFAKLTSTYHLDAQ